MISYTPRRAARTLLAAAGLVVAVGLIASAGNGCAASPCLDAGRFASWLGRLARLDLGHTADGGSVAAAIGSAAPASVLLVASAALLILLLGWGGGLLLAMIERREAHASRMVGHGLAAAAQACRRSGWAGCWWRSSAWGWAGCRPAASPRPRCPPSAHLSTSPRWEHIPWRCWAICWRTCCCRH